MGAVLPRRRSVATTHLARPSQQMRREGDMPAGTAQAQAHTVRRLGRESAPCLQQVLVIGQQQWLCSLYRRLYCYAFILVSQLCYIGVLHSCQHWVLREDIHPSVSPSLPHRYLPLLPTPFLPPAPSTSLLPLPPYPPSPH